MLALCVHSCQDRRIFGRSTLYIGYLVDPFSFEYLSVRAPLINLQLQHNVGRNIVEGDVSTKLEVKEIIANNIRRSFLHKSIIKQS